MRFSFTNSKDNENLSFDESSVNEDKNHRQSSCQSSQYDSSDVLTIEGLRRHYNSCSDCGVCWYDDHVNLDCSECGGYAMCRPCPKCNGQCGAMWKRDVTASHVSKKAEWVGSCSLNFQWNSSNILDSSDISEDNNSNLEKSYRRLHLSPKSKTFIREAHVL